MKCYPRFSHTRRPQLCAYLYNSPSYTPDNKSIFLITRRQFHKSTAVENENQFETFSFVPWLQESFMRGFRFRSSLFTDSGETLGTRSFFSRLGLSWLQPSPDPETFCRTRVKTPVTPASVPLPLPLPLLTPATQASQGISFATIFKIHVTVCPVLFPCDLLKLTLRLRVETYLPFRHLRKQHKCCNLHSLCFMSLWLSCYTSLEGIVNFWYESKLSLRPLTSNSLVSDQLWPASWKFVSKSFELVVKL